jgi:hypothetical protein
MAGDPHPVFRNSVPVDKSEARSYIALRFGTIDELRDADGSTFWVVFIDELNAFFERSTTDTTSADDGETVIIDANGARWLRVGGGDVEGPDGGVTDGNPVVFDGPSGKVVKEATPLELKTTLDLENVDNTSDVNKPVSSAQQAALDLKIPLTYMDVDAALAANSDTKIASQKAVKSYIDAFALVVSGALIFKGAFDASAGSFPGTAGRKTGWFYRVSVAGTVDGVSFTVGDDLYAIVDTASTSTYAANWLKIEGALTSAEIIAALSANSIALSKLAQGTALSVLGVTGNATANYADMVAGTDGHVMRRSGTAIGFGTIATAGITDDAVTDDKLRNSAAVSVIGRSANSSGGPADIAAGANDRILARVSDALSFVQITIGMIPDALITFAKLASAAVAAIADVRAAVASKLLTADLIETASAVVTLTETGGAVAVDWDTFINGVVVVDQATAISNPTNGQPGTWRTIMVQGNDGTDRTITFGNQFLGEVPTIADCDSAKWYLLTIFCYTASHFVVSAKVAKT